MFKTIRRVLATLSFLSITILFLDFTGVVRHWFGWLAEIQFLPAILALNLAAVAFVIILTFAFGRIYCSVICPLGIMQDAIAWIRRRFKRLPYRYSKGMPWLRILALGAFIGGLTTHVAVIKWLAPYSTYGRFLTTLLQPLYIGANNLLASMSESMDNYWFYRHDMIWAPMLLVGLVLAHFIIICVLAWRGGRTYCNTICPVGTVLGVLGRFPLFRVRIDTDKCRNCGKCARGCKSSCIDAKSHTIDYTRCVVCGDCLDLCEFGALKLSCSTSTASKQDAKEPDKSRRAFLVTAAMATSATALAKIKMDGGLAKIEGKVAPERQTRVTPPGSLSAQNMAEHCTTCQLCISECPNHVLRPSTSLTTFMLPEMSFERGYCRPECTRCADVCPTGAIHHITAADKTAIHIGHAVWIRQNCIPLTNGDRCGNCARHCPTGAITMVPSDPNDEQSPWIPTVNEAVCIGCGACENLCPARPLSAIMVEGNEVHIED